MTADRPRPVPSRPVRPGRSGTPRGRAAVVQALEGRRLVAGVPAFDHVVVVIEENHSPSQVIGSAEAPYINSLARGGAYLSQSFGTHRPSQPNYLALFSGSNQGVTTNNNVNLGNVANLGSQLIAKGKTFVTYSEDLPYAGFTGATSGSYARKHNPVVSFSNVPAASNRPFTDFPSDFTALPSVAFVVPNLDNDSHDGTVDTSDRWLEDKLSGYAEWARAHRSLLVVTYDEGGLSDATNQVATILYGAGVKQGTYATRVNHYNVLRTLEDANGLAPLANAASAAPIDWVFAPPADTTPTAPTGLRATAAGASRVDLAWTDTSTTETGFRVERSTDGVTFAPVTTVGASVTAFADTGRAASTRYYYRVRAEGAPANSAYGNVASATTAAAPAPRPAAPTNLVATVVGGTQIDLAWSDHATDETGYRIERSTDGTNFAPLAGGGANVTSYRNTGLTPGRRYYYRVYAVNGAGSSAFSNVASATTSAGSAVPAAPTKLVLTSARAGTVDLAWADNATNETGYRIERSTDGVNFAPLAGGGANTTSYRNTGLAAGRRYYYRVYAVNATGRSGYSNVASRVA